MQPQASVPARKGAPGIPSRIQDGEDSHHQRPSSHLWVTGVQARAVGALLLSSDQAMGTRPWEMAVTGAGMWFPTWSPPCRGQDAKCYLLENVKSEIGMKSTDRELALMMRTRGAQRTGMCEIVSTFSVGTRVQNFRRVSRWPSPTSESTEIPLILLS